jgi:hypothetical protein
MFLQEAQILPRLAVEVAVAGALAQEAAQEAAVAQEEARVMDAPKSSH